MKSSRLEKDKKIEKKVITLKRFISNIESVSPKPKDMIKFVRKGAGTRRKKSPHIGILHYALDWKLLTDLHD